MRSPFILVFACVMFFFGMFFSGMLAWQHMQQGFWYPMLTWVLVLCVSLFGAGLYWEIWRSRKSIQRWPNWLWNLHWKWGRFKIMVKAWRDSRARKFRLPKVRHDPPIPPNSNAFHYDGSSMGTPLVKGWIAMHGSSQFTGLVLVNQNTGQRIRITLR